MPYVTELTDDCMGIVHAGRGVVTGADLVAATKAATQLVQNTANFNYEFIDLTDVTELRTTEDELEEIVAQDHLAALFRPQATIIIVAPREELFRFARAWQQRVQDLGWNTHISRDREEAISWLKENYPAPPVAQEPEVR